MNAKDKEKDRDILTREYQLRTVWERWSIRPVRQCPPQISQSPDQQTNSVQVNSL